MDELNAIGEKLEKAMKDIYAEIGMEIAHCDISFSSSGNSHINVSAVPLKNVSRET